MTCRQMRTKIPSQSHTFLQPGKPAPFNALRRVDLPTNIGHLDKPMQNRHVNRHRFMRHVEMEHPKPSRSILSCEHGSVQAVVPSISLPRHGKTLRAFFLMPVRIRSSHNSHRIFLLYLRQRLVGGRNRVGTVLFRF